MGRAEILPQRFGEIQGDVGPFPLRMVQNGRLDYPEVGAMGDQPPPQSPQFIHRAVPVYVGNVLAWILESQTKILDQAIPDRRRYIARLL